MAVKISPVTRTAIGSLLQDNLLAGKQQPLLAGTTLNELLQIQQKAVLGQGENPRFGYYAIGNKGHTSSIVDGTDTIIDLYKHAPEDCACWNHIPFVLREEANDLSADLRLNYGLRRSEQHNGKNYFAYYLKRINLSGTSAKVMRTTVVNGVTNTEEYKFSNANLNPVRPVVLPDQATTTANDYLSTTMPVTVAFDLFDVNELFNVAAVLWNNEKRAIISELAFCSGVDRNIQTVGAGGAQINFKEVIGCQVITHVTTYKQLSIDNEGFNINMEVGATEPMLTGSALSAGANNDLLAQARSTLLSNISIT